MNCTGSLKIHTLRGSMGEYLCEESVVPIKFECDAVAGAADADDSSVARKMKVCVCDISARRDADGVSYNVELALCGVAVRESRVRYVSSITAIDGEIHEACKNVIRVYVPDKNESAWDVEKKFRLGREAKLEGGAYIV